MSKINTNSLNANFPVAGINNDSQGLRDNFNNIKTNLNTAAVELNDLQSKAIVKAALNNSTVDNDMANTLISNALVRSFRASTYNIGNNVTTDGDQNGKWIIDVSKGDVQYGTLTGNVNLEFGGWAPAGTQSNVQLILNVASTAVHSSITLPLTHVGTDGQPTTGMLLSTRQIEGYISNRAPAADQQHTNGLRVPQGINKLHYMISTENCGATIQIVPIVKRQSLVIGNAVPVVNSVTTDATGLIISVNDDDTVWGYNTEFNSQLTVGSQIVNSSNVVVGTVSAVLDNNHLNLSTFGNINVPVSTKTGTITSSVGSGTITGSGTDFTGQLFPGDYIVDADTYDQSGGISFVGVVSSIANNTSLTVLNTMTMVEGAEIDLVGSAYYIMRPYAFKVRRSLAIGSPGDKRGDISSDGTYLYICLGDYTGSANIWKKVSLSGI